MHIPPYLVNPHYNDRYFDVVDAIIEAKKVFFDGTDILAQLHSPANFSRTLTIGETGFGAGRILVALIDYLKNSDVTNCRIIYNSVELHPLAHEHLMTILESFKKECGPAIDTLCNAYNQIDITTPQWHQVEMICPFGSLVLNLWIGEALEMVNALDTLCDVWFLDGHGPKTNPAMWRNELLAAIGKKAKPGGTVATYTVAGAVKRGLRAAGFTVEKVQGCGGKKEVLRGTKTNDV